MLRECLWAWLNFSCRQGRKYFWISFFLFNRTCLKYAYNIPFTLGNQKWVPLIFSSSSCFSQVHNILAEMVMGGMVLETNMNEIITQVDAQNKMEKSEVSLTCPPTVCMTWFYLHTFWGTRHSMQACVYAAPCMRLSGDLVDAPDLLFECLCSFFSRPLLSAAALLLTQVLSISPVLPLTIMCRIVDITFVI